MTPKDNPLLKNKYLLLGIIITGIVGFFWLWSVIVLHDLKMDVANSHPLSVLFIYLDRGESPAVAKAIKDAGVIAFTLIFVLFLVTVAKTPKDKLHGDAKWANERDMKKANLLSGEGVLLGRIGLFKKRWLTLPFDPITFIMLWAPTRRGKGIGFVIPNCLNWPESLVVNDNKLENWEKTSGFRKACGHEVYLINFSPDDYKTHRWNPLHYISPNPDFRVDDIDKIAAMLIKEASDGDIWVPEARTLFRGYVLFLIETEGLFPLTLGEVYRQNNTEKNAADYWKEMLERYPNLSGPCRSALASYANNAEKTRQGIKTQLNTALSIFANPVVDAATSESDFYLGDIRKKRMSIYVGTKLDKMAALSNLQALFWEQLVTENIKELPEKNPDLKYQVLMMMDEFTALGKLEVFNKGVSYIAGYGLRLATIFQSMGQMRGVYGEHDTDNYVDNHGCWVVMTPRRFKQAAELADEIGYVTAESKSKGKSTGENNSTRSENTSEAKRHLILPQDIKMLSNRKSMVLLDGFKPMIVERVKYFELKDFEDRLLPAAEAPVIDVIHHESRGKEEPVEEYVFDDAAYEEVKRDTNIDPDQEAFTDEEIMGHADAFLQSLSD